MEPKPQRLAALLAVLRWFMAALFLAAGGIKAADPAAAVLDIANYHLLPESFVLPAGWYVPWLEIGCGWALLTRRLQAGGWMLAVLLSASFAVFTGSALWRGLDISCGCFGSQSSPGQLPWMATLDLVMLLVSVYGLKCRLPAHRSKLQGSDASEHV